MFTPMDIGTFDNLLAMEADTRTRNKDIESFIVELVNCKSVEGREAIAEDYGYLEPFTKDEIRYINSCLKANKIL